MKIFVNESSFCPVAANWSSKFPLGSQVQCCLSQSLISHQTGNLITRELAPLLIVTCNYSTRESSRINVTFYFFEIYTLHIHIHAHIQMKWITGTEWMSDIQIYLCDCVDMIVKLYVCVNESKYIQNLCRCSQACVSDCSKNTCTYKRDYVCKCVHTVYILCMLEPKW